MSARRLFAISENATMRFDSQRQRRRVFSRNIPPSLGAIAREHDSRLCFPEAACVKLFQTLLYSLEGEKKRKGVEGFHRREAERSLRRRLEVHVSAARRRRWIFLLKTR